MIMVATAMESKAGATKTKPGATKTKLSFFRES
jgi:hypothetical protein